MVPSVAAPARRRRPNNDRSPDRRDGATRRAHPRPHVGPEVEHRDRRQRQPLGQGHRQVTAALDRPLELDVGPDQADPPHPRTPSMAGRVIRRAAGIPITSA